MQLAIGPDRPLQLTEVILAQRMQLIIIITCIFRKSASKFSKCNRIRSALARKHGKDHCPAWTTEPHCKQTINSYKASFGLRKECNEPQNPRILGMRPIPT